VSTAQTGSSYRAKTPAEVVRDALAMASRKQRDGCEPCVQAYLDLARRNGATEDLINFALAEGADYRPAMPRRAHPALTGRIQQRENQ
jgi:hypothetical protein